MGHANMITFHFPIETRILRTACSQYTLCQNRNVCPESIYPIISCLLASCQLFVDKRTFLCNVCKKQNFWTKKRPLVQCVVVCGHIEEIFFFSWPHFKIVDSISASSKPPHCICEKKKVLIYLEGPDIITTSHKLLNKCILKYLHAGKFHSCQHKSLSKIKVDFSNKL